MKPRNFKKFRLAGKESIKTDDYQGDSVKRLSYSRTFALFYLFLSKNFDSRRVSKSQFKRPTFRFSYFPIPSTWLSPPRPFSCLYLPVEQTILSRCWTLSGRETADNEQIAVSLPPSPHRRHVCTDRSVSSLVPMLQLPFRVQVSIRSSQSGKLEERNSQPVHQVQFKRIHSQNSQRIRFDGRIE